MSDNEDVPFNRTFPLKPGIVEEVRPGVRRVLCNNPSPFTFTGTVSYIVGNGNVAIIDPGPDDAAHAAALLDAVRGETVSHIFVTHTHRDHSPNTTRIKQATGAPVYAEGPHRASRPRFESEKHNPESGADRDFAPDIRIAHGDVVEGDGWRLEAVATARPHRQSSRVRLARAEVQFRRRPRDGLVDLDRGAARRLDDRLHGIARSSRRTR
ncbi:glyoxylase-like metal-dependent hydrolase (beta-lactamase superfamily II) [Bradyrhizobium sp. USDA 4486]